MKLKDILLAFTISTCATAAHAQTAGDFILSTGWNYIMPQHNTHAFEKHTLGGIPVEPSQPGSVKVEGKGSALNLSGTYFITDHLASSLMFNTGTRLNLDGAGYWSSYGKLTSIDQWNASLSLQYYFRDAQAPLRPFVGAGISRVWFTKISFLDKFGGMPGSKPTLSVKDQWAPVFDAGLSYQFNKNGFASLSVRYMPLQTTAKIESLTTTNPQLSLTSEAKLKLNPIITSLSVGYRF